MKGPWTRAWLISLSLTVPSLVHAQSTPTEEPSAPAVEATESEAAPADADKKADEKKADAKKADESAAETPEAAPADAAPADAAPAETPAAADPEAAVKAAAEKAAADLAAEEAKKAAADAKAAEAKKADEMKAMEAEAAKAAAKTEADAKAGAAKADAKADAAKAGAAKTADAKKAADGKDGEKGGKKKEKSDAILGASAPVPPDVGRPWQVFATFEQTLGIGAFVKNADARQPAYGYNVSVTGTYKLGNFLDGRLDAFGGFSFDQALTTNFNSVDPTPRRFYFRDVFLGVTGRGLIQEKKVTGIIFGANTSISLPTSEISQNIGRYFLWRTSGSAVRSFKVGPGNLMLTFSEAFSKDVGSGQGDLNNDGGCLYNSRDDGCATMRASTNYILSHRFGMLYFWGSFSGGASLSIINIRRYNQNGGDNADPSSIYGGAAPWANQTVGNLFVGYAFNSVISTRFGTTTWAGAYFNNDGNNSALRFPLFDFKSTGNNITQFFLDLNIAY